MAVSVLPHPRAAAGGLEPARPAPPSPVSAIPVLTLEKFDALARAAASDARPRRTDPRPARRGSAGPPGRQTRSCGRWASCASRRRIQPIRTSGAAGPSRPDLLPPPLPRFVRPWPHAPSCPFRRHFQPRRGRDAAVVLAAGPPPQQGRLRLNEAKETCTQQTRNEAQETCRADVWLWRARFFKTRSLAARIIEDGGVRLARGGARAPLDKPSRSLRPGDVAGLRPGPRWLAVKVEALGERRGPAPEARALYSLIEGRGGPKALFERNSAEAAASSSVRSMTPRSRPLRAVFTKRRAGRRTKSRGFLPRGARGNAGYNTAGPRRCVMRTRTTSCFTSMGGRAWSRAENREIKLSSAETTVVRCTPHPRDHHSDSVEFIKHLYIENEWDRRLCDRKFRK